MAISEISRDELEAVFKGRPHLDTLRQKIARGEADFSPPERVQWFLTHARVYELRGEFARANAMAENAEQFAREHADSKGICAALAMRAYMQLRFGDYTRAAQLSTKAIAWDDSSHASVQALRALAWCAYVLNDWARAETCFKRAALTSRKLDFPFGLCTSLMDITELYYSQGRFELALEALEESNRVSARADLTIHRGFEFVHRASIYCMTGKRTEARMALQGLEPFITSHLLESYYHEFGAWLALLEEDWIAADQELQCVRELGETHGDAAVIGATRWLSSWRERARGNFGSALEWAEEAVASARRSTMQYDEGLALMERARVYIALNDVPRAQADLDHVSEIAHALGAKFLAAEAAFQRAALHWQLQRDDAEYLWLDAARQIQYGGYGFLLERERALAFPMVAEYARSRAPALRASAEKMLEQLARVPPLPLRVIGLGRFAVWQGNHKIPERDWSKRRAGELFRFLLLQPEYAASRDALLDALVPDASPESAQTFLHHATSALRHILEPDLPEKFPSRYLDVQSESIALHLPSGSWIDFESWQQALHAATRAEELADALKLYGGELFSQDRYADWSVEARERLAERHRNALLTLAAMQLENENPQAALDTCRKILADDPWREDAVLLGMRAALALDNRPTALKLYRALERALRDEFDIAPREDVAALARSISDKAIL